MKKQISLLLLLVSTLAFSQRTPLHPLDINEGKTNLYDILESWEPGTPPEGSNDIDDQFYISRVRPLERIVDGDYQVNSKLKRDKKLCMWVPMDEPSGKWKTLPRYCFEGDNFGMWSYLDIQGNWSAPWIRVTAGLTDVAHKNGVKVGCVYGIPWAQRIIDSPYSEHGKIFYRLFEKNTNNEYKYAAKLVKLMKYYGIDGMGCNSEFSTNKNFMDKLEAFVLECKKQAKLINWNFQLHWYDGTNDNGHITFDNGLGDHNKLIFGDSTRPVTDMLFFNYNWNYDILSRSVAKAKQLKRSSFDIYAGFDIQKSGFTNYGWSALSTNDISIGLWGAHTQSLLHQSATDNGASDIAIQNAYLLKQELAFSGGHRNPGLTPAIRTNSSLGNEDLKTFHGLATFLTAKSTIQQLPFVTRFSLGNGLFFNNKGKIEFQHKWYNLSTQDFLPTWRWWITDKEDKVTEENITGLIKADLIFDDAWFGGSCLKIHGKTDFSRVKLFKTKLSVKPNDKISLTYKTLNGVESNAKIFVTLKNKITEYKEIALPKTEKAGEWYTFTTTLSKLGISANDVVSMIGVAFEKTEADYSILLGELSVKDPAQKFNTVAPTIKTVELLRGRHNQLDYKIRFSSKDESNGVKTYNDEVGTWYYEIYFQQKNQPIQLLTATTSWAAYVIDAPLAIGGVREGRFGVRAVSPDGDNGSVIVWSEYKDIPYNQPLENVIIDKPVIKPNEKFVVKFEDTMHENAKLWEIKDPISGKVLATQKDAKEISTSIDKVGLYDLHLTNNSGTTTITRGFIQITAEETGAVPTIFSFGSDKKEAQTNETVKYNYTSKDGEGMVSKSLKIEDPSMLRLPAEVGSKDNYTLSFWFKADKWGHDKFGTNLINKRDFTAKWPHNNWGTFWVHVWPDKVYDGVNPNIISFTQWHMYNLNISPGFNGNIHESPNRYCMGNDFSIPTNVWTHVAISIGNGKQNLWVNGKMVASETISFGGDNKQNGAGINPIYVYIGGSNVYHAGFNGLVDDVQYWTKALNASEIAESMKGYYKKDIPADLAGYWDFEGTAIEDGTAFSSTGKMKGLTAKLVKLVGSGGEDTGGAVAEGVKCNTSNTGSPAIAGSLPIKTTAKWNLEGAEMVKTDAKKVEVTYEKEGKYSAGVSITNPWGTAEVIKEDYITIKMSSGVNDVEQRVGYSIFPNPIVERVNLKFDNSGVYVVNLLSSNGTLVESKTFNVSSNETVSLDVNAPAGVYLVSIKDINGTLLKSVKVVKK